MTSKDIASLSKCCFILIFLCLNLNVFAQNVISVKKKPDTTKVEVEQDTSTVTSLPEEEAYQLELSGFFYSEPFTLSKGRPGEPPTDYRRMIVYIDSYGRVFLFHSTQSVKKLYQKFAKNPDKLTEEYGSLEITAYGDLYLNTQPPNTMYGSYKYVGEFLSNDQFYLDYKATIDSKVALKIYLHKY